MDDTNTQLDAAIKRRADSERSSQEAELEARRKQVQVLQGLTFQCGIIKCPKCGQTLLDPRPRFPEDDYDTRA